MAPAVPVTADITTGDSREVDIQRALVDLKVINAENQAALDSANYIIQQSRTERDSLQQRIGDLLAELQAEKKRNDELEKNSEELKHQISDFLIDQERLRSERNAMERQNSILNDQNRVLQEEYDDVHDLLVKSQMYADRLLEERRDLRSSLGLLDDGGLGIQPDDPDTKETLVDKFRRKALAEFNRSLTDIRRSSSTGSDQPQTPERCHRRRPSHFTESRRLSWLPRQSPVAFHNSLFKSNIGSTTNDCHQGEAQQEEQNGSASLRASSTSYHSRRRSSFLLASGIRFEADYVYDSEEEVEEEDIFLSSPSREHTTIPEEWFEPPTCTAEERMVPTVPTNVITWIQRKMGNDLSPELTNEKQHGSGSSAASAISLSSRNVDRDLASNQAEESGRDCRAARCA